MMPRSTTPPKSREEQLRAHFGDHIECSLAILDTLQSEDRREYRASELVEITGHRLIDVIVTLARLTVAGLIDRADVGRYCCIDPQREQRAG
jgi:hypothetical protein